MKFAFWILFRTSPDFITLRIFARIALEKVSSGKTRGKTALPSFLPSFQPPGSVELDTEKKQRKEKKQLLQRKRKNNYYKEQVPSYCVTTSTLLTQLCAQHSGPGTGAAGRVLTRRATVPVRGRPTRGPTRAAARHAGPPLADLGQGCSQSLRIGPASPRCSTTCGCTQARSTAVAANGWARL